MVGDFLKAKGVKNFLVEIGGELSSYGKNYENKLWRVGIEKPIDGSFVGEFEFQKIIELDNQSLATSGVPSLSIFSNVYPIAIVTANGSS